MKLHPWKKTSPWQAMSLLGCEMESPPAGTLKINTNDSSYGNPGHAGTGDIGRDNDGGMVFLFSIYKGHYSNNLMEALAINIVVERGFSLG